MSVRQPSVTEIRSLPTVSARARSVRAYFLVEKDMRALRDETIRELRREGLELTAIADEVACSVATVKTALRARG